MLSNNQPAGYIPQRLYVGMIRYSPVAFVLPFLILVVIILVYRNLMINTNNITTSSKDTGLFEGKLVSRAVVEAMLAAALAKAKPSSN